MFDFLNDPDPRSAWRWLARVTRATPTWLLRSTARVTSRIILLLFRRSFDKTSPEYRGFHLWVDGVNADLYGERVKAALDVVALHAPPVYLRWLRSSFDVLNVSQLFMIARTVTNPDYSGRILGVHPYTVWKVSHEQLALYFVAAATRGRLGAAFRRNRLGAIRAGRRELHEMIACARILPSNEGLVTRCQKRLDAFNKEFPPAAA